MRRLATLALLLAALPASAARSPLRRLYRPTKAPLPAGPIVKIRAEGGVYPHLGEPAYRDLRNACIELLKRFPPDKHVYVGLGRDPAPIIAFLQEIGTRALNFPASGQSIGASDELDRHFTKLIPRSIRAGDRTIVLIDQTTSGKTHSAVMPLLKRYLRRTGSKVEVVGAAYNEGRTLSRRITGVSVIDTKPFPEVFKFFYEPYEGIVSPFERHEPSSEAVEDVVYRPQYDQFRAGIRKRIERDARLDRFLAALASRRGVPSRAQAWELRRPYRKGLPSLRRGPLLEVGDAQLPVLDERDYESVSFAARELIGRFPPGDGRFYLGVGRTASPIVAFLEILGSKRVATLAADGLYAEANPQRLSQEFANYFDRALPARVLERLQTITVFQHVRSGKSLEALKQLLERYLKARGSQSTVEVVALSRPSDRDGQSYLDYGDEADELRYIDLRGRQQFNSPAFKASARYPYHRVGKNELADLRTRPDHERFKRALATRMQRDHALDEFLAAPE